MALTDNEISYLIKEINIAKRAIDSEYFEVYYNSDKYGPYERSVSEAWLEDRIYDLFLMISTYLEAKGMNELLKSFKAQFEVKIKSKDKLLEICGLPYGDHLGVEVIEEIEQYLSCFLDFNSVQKKDEFQIKVHSILESTSHILKRTATVINNEASIYNAVKWVLSLYFPRVKQAGSAFTDTFSEYKPDILIPEIRTAIEYKYIRKDMNPAKYIEGLIADAKNYNGDSRYQNFIAVMYFEDSHSTTKEVLSENWKSKKFPKEWTPIFCFH